MSEHTTRPAKLYSERFDMIDAFRGLAALAVVVHHVLGGHDARFRIGHPAVMVFFVISGYCIASAADACQRKGLTFAQFMWRRIRRIYPPYLLSLAFWAATRILKWKLEGVNDLNRTWTEWAQNISLTQWFSLVTHPANFAHQNKTLFVSVYWSLNYEEQFYLVFGFLLFLAGVIGLNVRATVAALVGASIVWIALLPATCYGFFIEYWAMFGVGTLVFYRLCRLTDPFSRRASDAAIIAIFLISVSLRVMGAGAPPPANLGDWMQPDFRSAWGDLAISSGFALLLLVLRPLDTFYKSHAWIARPLGSLGLITYSLYLVHQFNLNLVASAVSKALHLVHADNPPLLVSVSLQCALHIGIATVFWYLCERPFLNKSLLPASPAAPAPKPEKTSVAPRR